MINRSMNIKNCHWDLVVWTAVYCSNLLYQKHTNYFENISFRARNMDNAQKSQIDIIYYFYVPKDLISDYFC